MALVIPVIIQIIREQAVEEYFESGEIRELVDQAVRDCRRDNAYLRNAYNFDPERHRMLDNKHNAVRSTGCGCVLCMARHEYAKADRTESLFRRAYIEENVYYYEDFLQRYYISGTSLSEDAYFKLEAGKLNALTKAAKLRFQSVKSTIDELLRL